MMPLLFAPLRLLRDYPWQAALLACALLAFSQHRRAGDWQARSRLEAANHRQTKANYAAAQSRAARFARAARAATEARYARIAKEADDANDEADLWRTRAREFADAGGLHGAQRIHPPGPARTAPGACEDSPASQRPPSSSPAVTLTRADFETLSANTARLLKVHAWGEKLIAEGFALPADEP